MENAIGFNEQLRHLLEWLTQLPKVRRSYTATWFRHCVRQSTYDLQRREACRKWYLPTDSNTALLRPQWPVSWKQAPWWWHSIRYFQFTFTSSYIPFCWALNKSLILLFLPQYLSSCTPPISELYRKHYTSPYYSKMLFINHLITFSDCTHKFLFVPLFKNIQSSIHLSSR